MTKAGFTQTMFGSEGSSQTGTQLYMAPELLAGKTPSIRSDICSLGVVLYQLLVGDFKRPVTTDWSKQVEDPLLREDLALCFAGQPQERFAGAGQLAKNLRALPQRQAARAAEEAEHAAREKAAYRRGVVRTAALAVLLVAGFAGLAIYAIQQAGRAERTAIAETHQRYSAEMNLAQQAYAEGKVARALCLLEKHIPARGVKEDLRGFEWRYLWRLCQQDDALHTFRAHTNAVTAVAFADRGRLVSCSSNGLVKVFDTPTKQEMASLGLKENVNALVISADGSLIATSLADGLVKAWKTSTTEERTAIPNNGPVSRLALSPDGRTLAIACANRVRVWDCVQRSEIAEFPWRETGLSSLAFSPDRRLLAGACLPLRFWNIAENREEEAMLEPHTGVVIAMAFSADGRTLATTAWDTTLKLWTWHRGSFWLPSRAMVHS